MTTNQVAYWNVVEAKRNHLAQEIETNRANLARESETHRSNIVNEAETMRSNLANERLKQDQNEETKRSNLARETETHRSNVVNENENKRSNVAREKETRRSNKATEAIRKETNKETKRSNLANEAQTRVRDAQNYSVGSRQAAAAQSQAAAAHRNAAANEQNAATNRYNAITNRYNAITARQKAESDILKNESDASKTWYGTAKLVEKYGPQYAAKATQTVKDIQKATVDAAQDFLRGGETLSAQSNKYADRINRNVKTIANKLKALPGKAIDAYNSWANSIPGYSAIKKAVKSIILGAKYPNDSQKSAAKKEQAKQEAEYRKKQPVITQQKGTKTNAKTKKK